MNKTINDYFNTGYTWLLGIFKDLVLENRKDTDRIVVAIDKKSNEDVVRELSKVVSAIKEIEVTKEVGVNNIDDIITPLIIKLDDVIETLKDEIQKTDKEVVINSNFSPLEEAIKSKNNNDIIAKLDGVIKAVNNKKIVTPKDYSIALEEIISTLSDINIPEINLKNIEKLLADIKSKEIVFPEQKNYLEDYAEYDRLKVILSDEQLSKMGGSGQTLVQQGVSNVRSKITDSSGDEITVQNPFPTNGDSLYAKDIDVDGSSIGAFSGSITDIFDDLDTTIVATADNPTFTIKLNRPIDTATFRMCAKTGNFSNVTITMKDGSGATVATINDSANSTKYTSKEYSTTPVAFCTFTVLFSTTDTVSISFLSVQKSLHTHSQLLALKPNGTATFIDATNGGNLKISLEELESAISTNSNTQLRVTPFDSTGMEGGIPRECHLDIPAGRITGETSVNKFGRSREGIQTTATDVWDRADATPTQQLWVAPTVARVHNITSSSTSDDGTPEGAGVGAQAVIVYGLTSWSTAEVSETVILNGTANVATVNSYVIIHRMKVTSVGSTYKLNVGTITATAVTDATVTAQINASEGQTQMAIYGIPSTKNAYMTCYYATVHENASPGTTTEMDIKLLVNEAPNLNTNTFLVKSTNSAISGGTSYVKHCFEPYNKISGPAIIKIQALSTAADTDASAGFDLILVNN